jgi:hypothetical protein
MAPGGAVRPAGAFMLLQPSGHPSVAAFVIGFVASCLSSGWHPRQQPQRFDWPGLRGRRRRSCLPRHRCCRVACAQQGI